MCYLSRARSLTVNKGGSGVGHLDNHHCCRNSHSVSILNQGNQHKPRLQKDHHQLETQHHIEKRPMKYLSVSVWKFYHYGWILDPFTIFISHFSKKNLNFALEAHVHVFIKRWALRHSDMSLWNIRDQPFLKEKDREDQKQFPNNCTCGFVTQHLWKEIEVLNTLKSIHAKNVWCYGEGYFGQKNLRKKCVNRDKM